MKKLKLNELERQTLERKISHQQVKHAKVYSDLLPGEKRTLDSTLDSQQREH